MNVKVLCFAALREETGFRERDVAVEEGSTIGDLWKRLQEEFESLRSVPMPLVAVNETYAAAGEVLRPGDEVALIPPVAGG